jgi:hypothetical protein
MAMADGAPQRSPTARWSSSGWGSYGRRRLHATSPANRGTVMGISDRLRGLFI